MPEAPGWTLERQLWEVGSAVAIGIDEAGRGCLAGPVTAAAVILPWREDYPYRDSKELSAAARTELAARVREEATAWAIGWASSAEIDTVGILNATHMAALRAADQLPVLQQHAGLVTDWLKLDWAGPVLAVARADRRSCQVAAASILAKTARDAHLLELADRFPGYGFERHKGYGTKLHLGALDQLGPCPEHRLSFAPVAARNRAQLTACTMPS